MALIVQRCRNRTTEGGNRHAGDETNRLCRAAARLWLQGGWTYFLHHSSPSVRWNLYLRMLSS